MVKLVVGLGNPGPRYAETRHNVGFKVVDILAARWGVDVSREKHGALIGEGKLPAGTTILAKPQTFMNLSGNAVGALCRWYKILPEEIVVIYDDLDLPPGRIRIRGEGGAGGHRGMQSIIEHLGTEGFPRLRIGIGRPPEYMAAADYVLQPFSPEERPMMGEVFTRAAAAVETIISQGLEAAMNLYNR